GKPFVKTKTRNFNAHLFTRLEDRESGFDFDFNAVNGKFWQF
ncbi:MAG: hypothetical protein CFH02_01189, partial [Alphaproteobacteria bacterium MarineAlpha3_Bin1]